MKLGVETVNKPKSRPDKAHTNGNGAKRPTITQKEFFDALKKVSRKIPAGKSK